MGLNKGAVRARKPRCDEAVFPLALASTPSRRLQLELDRAA